MIIALKTVTHPTGRNAKKYYKKRKVDESGTGGAVKPPKKKTKTPEPEGDDPEPKPKGRSAAKSAANKK